MLPGPAHLGPTGTRMLPSSVRGCLILERQEVGSETPPKDQKEVLKNLETYQREAHWMERLQVELLTLTKVPSRAVQH